MHTGKITFDTLESLNNTTRGENGMTAKISTTNPFVDLFFKVGASRGHNLVPDFIQCVRANPDLAIRLALWARDVRGGAGEREHFRNFLNILFQSTTDTALLLAIAKKVPEVGRWDDLLDASEGLPHAMNIVAKVVADALERGDGLCAKWMPRKGAWSVYLRESFGMSPKQYRKTLVSLTKVVETPMCAKEWHNINYNHVPSRAAKLYSKAFTRHDSSRYNEYLERLTVGDPRAKINASAIFPHEIIGTQGLGSYYSVPLEELKRIQAQWDALPNYLGEANDILPVIDTSGSMTSNRVGTSKYSCAEVATAIGIYIAERNEGALKNQFITFSERPTLFSVAGKVHIVDKVRAAMEASWSYNTDLDKTLDLVLAAVLSGKVKRAPRFIVILSDMQFDECVNDRPRNATALIEERFRRHDVKMPKVIFWNLRHAGNFPEVADKDGVAMVSGFSTAIMKSILKCDKLDAFTPEGVMMQTLMNDRYSLV